MRTIQFEEVQRFRVWWAWLGVIALNILFVYAFVQQVILGIPFGSKPASNLVLVLIMTGPLLLMIFLVSIKLKTTIDDTGIRYRYFPFQLKTVVIEWNELNDAYIREYNSFHEYGGWGIRTGSQKKGRAINTSESCDQGLQLQFNDGSLLLIGTKRPEAIREIIEEKIKSGKINRRI